jgi:hypothetical protein|nr:MAG TPA: hypothetical protein [Caudoviricetes sp.]
MAKSKRYNPYEDAKNILKYKGNYHTAKQMGANYDQYKEAAKPYYQNLRFNGYGELADQFDASDFIKAQELFKGLKPDTTVDDYFADLYSKTAEAQSTPKISQAAEDMWNAWNNTNTTLNGNEIKYDRNGNVVSGLNVDHYNTGRNQLGYLNNFDVTAQPYYQGIMNSFQLQGNNAARGEQATGAANNAGNIDSYAQANANRQQLAFTSKGLEAALAAANQNQQNWQTLYDSMTGHLDNMGNQNANVLNAYQNIYSTDSLERQNTLNTAAELAKQEMQSKIDKYLADVGYDQAVYTADKNLEGSKYKADANTLAAQIAADADRYTAQQNHAGKVYASDTDKAIAEINAKKKTTSEEDEDVPLSEAFNMILQEIGSGGNPAFRSWENVRTYLVDDNGYDAAEVDKMIDNYTGSQYYRGDPFSNYNWQTGVNSLLQKARAGDAKSAALLRELAPDTAAKYGF